MLETRPTKLFHVLYVSNIRPPIHSAYMPTYEKRLHPDVAFLRFVFLGAYCG